MATKQTDNLTDIPAVKAKKQPKEVIPKTPAVMGRPTVYNQDLVADICRRIADGESLRAIIQDEDMPDRSQIYRWLQEYPDFRDQYTKAKEDQAETFEEEMLHIARTEEDVARARLIVDTMKWTAAKLKPKKYGERQDPAPSVTFNFGTQNYVKKVENNS